MNTWFKVGLFRYELEQTKLANYSFYLITLHTWISSRPLLLVVSIKTTGKEHRERVLALFNVILVFDNSMLLLPVPYLSPTPFLKYIVDLNYV